MTDYWVNSLWRSLLKDGHYCSHNDIRAILMSDFSETFHPFRSYFEGLAPWDGVTDWIGQLADTVDTTRPAFWRGCLKRWLIAQVAGSMELGVETIPSCCWPAGRAGQDLVAAEPRAARIAGLSFHGQCQSL